MGNAEVIIRNAKTDDLEKLFEIEKKTFPPAERASLETIAERMKAYPDCFFAAEKNGEIVGFMNGCKTNKPFISDEMFHSIFEQHEDGENIAVCSLNVAPEFQKQGIAAEIMNHYINFAKTKGYKKVILTCKKHMIHYYEKFGFINSGISESTHGGAQWYNMILNLI